MVELLQDTADAPSLLASCVIADVNILLCSCITGAGKSTLLTAICCAFGCSAALLGVQSLAELLSTDTDEVRMQWVSALAVHACACGWPRTVGIYHCMQLCEVHVRIVDAGADAEHEVSLQLKPDNTRAYKIDGRNRTAKEVKARIL